MDEFFLMRILTDFLTSPDDSNLLRSYFFDKTYYDLIDTILDEIYWLQYSPFIYIYIYTCGCVCDCLHMNIRYYT